MSRKAWQSCGGHGPASDTIEVLGGTMRNVRRHRWRKGVIALLAILASGCGWLAGLGDFSEGSDRPGTDGSVPGLAMRIDPSTVIFSAGESVPVTITLSANPPLTRDALVQVEGLPPGIAAEPITIAAQAQGSATGILTFRADPAAGRISGESRIVAIADSQRGEASILVRVLGPPVVFDTPQSTPFTVPDGIPFIFVKMWGAGGGAGQAGAAGGAGAFVEGSVDVKPGDVLTFRVGTGGGGGANGGDDAGISGGGGAGLTAVFRGVPLMVAGAGGGGGGGSNGGIVTGSGAGGPGGANGGAGGGSPGGAGATDAGGGKGGSAGGGCDVAAAGKSLSGGNGAGLPPFTLGGDAGGGDGNRGEYGGGGGGGAGFFGGGGGGCGSNIIGVRTASGGGGGGSSLSAGKNARFIDGTAATPGAAKDPDYAGRAGKGGTASSDAGEPGGPGRIVIRY